MTVALTENMLQIGYDAGKVTPADMLRAVDKEGFKGKVVKGPTPAGAP